MGRRRFGRRKPPPPVQVSRDEAEFRGISGRTLFSTTEADRHVWEFQEPWESKDGAFRLLSVENLLSSEGTPAVDLIEWGGILSWPRDGASRHGVKLPRHWPKYAAISHVWKPSDDAARLANEANRPLRVRVDKREPPHQISWLGLVQAAVAAQALGCQYLWLDLLCLNQQSREDKKIQIRNMANIYQNATAVVVLPGGVVAAQNLDQPSSWIHRAWTLQEATLGWPGYVLVNWALPGSFSYFSKLSCPDGSGSVGLAPLEALVRHGPTKSLGVSMLAAQDGTGIRQFESDLILRCLGDEPAVLSILSSIIEDKTVRAPKPKSSDSCISFSSWDGEFSQGGSLPDPSTVSDFPDGGNGAISRRQSPCSNPDVSDRSSDWESHYSSDHSDGPFRRLTVLPRPGESAPIVSSSSHKRFRPTTGWRTNMLQSDDSEEEDDSSEGSYRIHPGPEARYSAVWRSMWLRTSTKEQDMVYSMMHLLDTELDVDYNRPLDELVFDLIVSNSSWSMPAWLTIGYNLPVRPESGLIPAFPTFTPNLNPTYHIDGKIVSASDLICKDEFFCRSFDIKFLKSSPTEGHFICAIIFNVVNFVSRRDDDEPGADRLSFHTVELSLSGAGEQTVECVCTLKGRVGEVAVVIGDYTTPGDMDRHVDSESRFIFFLGTEKGTRQKMGAGWLRDPLLSRAAIGRLPRRHMRVGMGSADEKPVECDCPKAPQAHDYIGEEMDADQLASLLAEAVSREDVPNIERLLDRGADPNRQVQYHGTALLLASFQGSARVVGLLLSRGADANRPAEISSLDLAPTSLGPWYGTPLQAACILDHEPVAHQLIEQGGVDVNAMAGPDGSALHAALKLPYSQRVVRLLLACGADVNAVGGPYGTCLMAAQAHDPPSLDLAKQLVDHGADINSVEGVFATRDGWLCRSALQMACRNNSVDMVRALIAMGANVNLCSGGSFATALQEAAYYGYSLVCEVLLENDAHVNVQGGVFGNALQAAVAGFAAGFRDRKAEICEYVLRLLLDSGADANAKGGYYGDVLSAVELIGEPSIIRVFIQRGGAEDGDATTVTDRPDSDLQSPDDWTELHLAASSHRLETVETLPKNGCDASKPDSDGRKPLHLASHNGRGDVVQALLRNNSAYRGMNDVDNRGCTPLHLASEAGCTAAVKALLAYGADPTLVNKEGQTAITAAVVSGHAAIVIMLLDRLNHVSRAALMKVFFELVWNGHHLAAEVVVNRYRIDCTQIDFHARTTAHMAAQSGQVDLLDYLLRRGVDPRTLDLQRAGLLHFASRSGSADMVDQVLPFFRASPAGSNDWSPLHWACRAGDVSVVERLLKRGYSAYLECSVVTVKPPGQWTPGDIAAFHNNRDIVSLFTARRLQATDLESHKCKVPVIQAPAPGPKDGVSVCHGCRLVCALGI
ncbi:hypothetical protein QQS21_002029 [Conoideocrella luteorostrata]|uniref:Heterokaryon incompatibility domain-containing protein n=1 Tax=Conoideocrella luteorostrata TaxID=1105319 RepID=A0AAJ0FXN2_9HYPO|nr:hypothetical protein QQS21_002029 [Conoideocrella luteorostrata]